MFLLALPLWALLLSLGVGVEGGGALAWIPLPCLEHALHSQLARAPVALLDLLPCTGGAFAASVPPHALFLRNGEPVERVAVVPVESANRALGSNDQSLLFCLHVGRQILVVLCRLFLVRLLGLALALPADAEGGTTITENTKSVEISAACCRPKFYFARALTTLP